MTYLFEILFFPLIIAIADIQAHMIGEGKAIRHFWWGCLFAALIAGAWLLEERNYRFGAALVLEHFAFFSPALNLLRSPRQPFFYVHSDPKKGSIWDKLAVLTGKFYPFIWAAGLIGFAVLQFFI